MSNDKISGLGGQKPVEETPQRREKPDYSIKASKIEVPYEFGSASMENLKGRVTDRTGQDRSLTHLI